VRADIERFAIDQLLSADPDGAAERRPRSFAVQVPLLTSVPVHWHDYYELGCVLAGEATHVVNGVAEHVGPGALFLLSPADLHGLEATTAEPLHVVNAVLEPAMVEELIWSVLPSGEAGPPWSTSQAAAGQEVERIRSEVESRRPGWEIVVEGVLRGLLVELARSSGLPEGAATSTGTAPGSSAAVRRAVQFVERHFREPLTLAQVASVAHLSPHWFSEQFRRATGVPFQRYLKVRRLRFARVLLGSTDLSVTEVCHAAGFNDPSYFARAYRAEYGQPPSGQAATRPPLRATHP
jgi:AraC-like DNA-binding protein/mannose-6-phosphate isomerase-like protein (cupin superfamily)